MKFLAAEPLERFQAKWMPFRVRKRIKAKIERVRDSIQSEHASTGAIMNARRQRRFVGHASL
jgi:hypothetical protein